ncbi:MAG: NACHT domain-containing protein [Ferruginibacter sp.]
MIICHTEDTFVDNLIDFSKYLEKIIYSYENDKLPFSYSNFEDEKYSLSQTFIPPRFTSSRRLQNTTLKSYIDQWLNQGNLKHLVVLGDYGMGKSTFMKYYASSLASQIVNDKNIVRYPIFISMTNNSPRHGGIDNAVGKFISDNLGVNKELFSELINRGKIVFLLDGFDEMGYVGTHDQRIKQLNAIWQLATKNNKLIISGRSSYFPTDKELIDSFNIIEIEEKLTPVNHPYFERIEIKEFDNNQIKESISAYNYSAEDKKKYLDFIFSNESIVDLSRRPSMMHIIREMLPKLFSEYKSHELNASNLMLQYIDHWIVRQLDKNIISSIDDKNKKKKFIWDVFIELASDFYLKGVEKQFASEILASISGKIQGLNLDDKNDIEGLEIEVLSGYFIEIEDGAYKFVHKSFKEYFISKKIVSLIEAKDFGHPFFTDILWSKEINDFIYDHFDIKEDRNMIWSNKLPFLYDKYSTNENTKKVCLSFFLHLLKMRDYLMIKPDNQFRRLQFLGLAYLQAIKILFKSRVVLKQKFISGVLSFLSTSSDEWETTIVNFIVKGYYYASLRNSAILNDHTYLAIAITKRFPLEKWQILLEKRNEYFIKSQTIGSKNLTKQ